VWVPGDVEHFLSVTLGSSVLGAPDRVFNWKTLTYVAAGTIPGERLICTQKGDFVNSLVSESVEPEFPLVSIIIPTHDRVGFLEHALNLIKQQGKRRFSFKTFFSYSFSGRLSQY